MQLYMPETLEDFLRENIAGSWINPFVPHAPFLYPLKTSENLKVN